MVAELGGEGPVVAWCALTTPCTSVFLPVAVGAELPAALTRGSGEPDAQAAWWLMKALGDEVMVDPVASHARRATRVARVGARAASPRSRPTGPVPTRRLGQHVAAMLQERETLLDQLAAVRPAVHGG